jgi:hypothetical protein
MCKFKSGIAIKASDSEVAVRVLPLNDSHTDIRKVLHIREENLGVSRYSTPVELVPTRLDFEDRSCWEFVFDASRPDWWVDGMTDQCIDQLLKAAKSDFEAMMGGQEYEGQLDLGRLTSIPVGFNPTVGGTLHLGGLTSVPKGFSPKVGENLRLGGVTRISDGFSPTVGGCLCLDRLVHIPDGFNPTIGKSLWLTSLVKIPDGFSPNVGGNIWMEKVTSVPDSVRKNVKGQVLFHIQTPY